MTRHQLCDAPEYKRDAIRVTIFFTVCIIVIKTIDPFFANTTERENSIAKNMLEQANQWLYVSLQDQNAQSKSQHISFASAYLHAARHVASDAILERLTGIDIHELQSAIETQQRSSSKEMVRQCPKLKLTKVSRPSKSIWGKT